MNKLSKITILVINIITIATFVFSILLYRENVRLKSDIDKRDRLLASTLNKDSTLSKKQDSIIKYVTRDLFFYSGDEKMNPEEFIRYVNSLHEQLETMSDSLVYYKTYYAMTNKMYGGIFKVHKKGGQMEFQYSGKDIQQMDSILQSKVGDIYMLQKENMEMELKLSMYKKAIDKYNIKFENYKNEGEYVTYAIKAAQVDSALMLLPFFRDKLTYNAKKGYWEVETRKGAGRK